MKTRREIYEQLFNNKRNSLASFKHTSMDKANRIANIYAVQNTNKAFLNQGVDTINKFNTNGYVHVYDELPKEDGIYDTIMHCGSMSISFKKVERLFRNGAFMRSDWNYVIMWKKD